MTESEWLSCTDPTPMLEFVTGTTTERKSRLFALTCVRSMWEFMGDERSRNADTVAEDFANGDASKDELRAALASARVVARAAAEAARVPRPGEGTDAAARAARGVEWAMESAPKTVNAAVIVLAYYKWEGVGVGEAKEKAVRGRQAALLRDVFGNPFRAISINPIWLTPTVTDLARAAYEERALPSGELEIARLAVLSDALEESGCDNADILNHLRGPGLHVRGCWVLDLLLGKS